MAKRVLKLQNVIISDASAEGSVVIGRLAEDDVIRGWPEGTTIRSSLIVLKPDQLTVGSRIETLNTIYEVV